MSLRQLGRRVGAHALRPSAATALLEKTGKIQAVSEYYDEPKILDIKWRMKKVVGPLPEETEGDGG